MTVTMTFFRFAAVNGEGLMEFKHLMHEDPQFFNKSLENQYKLAVNDVMTFRKALRKL